MSSVGSARRSCYGPTVLWLLFALTMPTLAESPPSPAPDPPVETPPPPEAPPEAAPAAAPAAPSPSAPPDPARSAPFVIGVSGAALAFLPPVPATPLDVAWPPEIVAALDEPPATVAFEILVDEAGKVEDVKLLSGEEPFASAALAVARATVFSPASEGGVPVAVWVPVLLEIGAPPVNVSGVVRIAGGGRAPAVGLPVTVAGRSVLTDAQGQFGFRGVPPGEQTLAVVDDTLRVDPKAFTVAPGEAIVLELWARPDRLDLGIVGTYRRERDETVRRTLTAEELRTTPGTMGDPLRAISNLPGAVRTPLDAGWLLVRGGDPLDTGVYIDGTRVPLIYHLGGFTSVVHPGFVERVEFYPGGQYARYGRATAGAVDLITRPRPENLEVRAGFNIVLAGAYAAVPITRTSGVTVGARRSYLDAVLNAVPGITDEQAGIAPRFWDWQLRADAGPFNIFGLGYVDTLNASTDAGEEAAVSVTTHRLHGGWRNDTALGKPIVVRPFVAYELYDLTIAVLDMQQLQQTVAGGTRIELADDGEHMIGWSAGTDAEIDAFGMRYNHVDRYGTVASPDVYADLRVGETWRVVAGARLDTMIVTGQLPRAALSPRANVEVPLNDWLSVHADAGLYHQLPALDLLVGPPEGSSLLLERS